MTHDTILPLRNGGNVTSPQARDNGGAAPAAKAPIGDARSARRAAFPQKGKGC
jgi:hypothetical protein